jgi:hypothetical protein
MVNMAGMPGMMPGYGFESLLGNLAGMAITLLIWVLFIGGTVFLVKGLWEAFKPKQSVSVIQDTVSKPVVTPNS